MSSSPTSLSKVRLVAVIKEVAPVARARTDEQLGVNVFQKKYFAGYPIYLDKNKVFYEALGNRSLLSQSWSSWNPFSWINAFRVMMDRVSKKGIDGNYAGEGFLQGGAFVIEKNKGLVYSYQEVTGGEFPVNDLFEAIKKHLV